jgi:dihydroorotase
LRREACEVPVSIGESDLALAPFRAGETLRWRLV